MNQKVEAKLEALRQIYTGSLPNKINEIEELWNATSLNFSKIQFEEFHRAVHSLAGSAGTYGYGSLSQSCRDLEVYLQQLLIYDSLNDLQKNEIAHLLQNIKDTNPKTKVDINEETDLNRPIFSKLIYYLIEKQENFQEELYSNLEHLGYDLII